MLDTPTSYQLLFFIINWACLRASSGPWTGGSQIHSWNWIGASVPFQVVLGTTRCACINQKWCQHDACAPSSLLVDASTLVAALNATQKWPGQAGSDPVQFSSGLGLMSWFGGHMAQEAMPEPGKPSLRPSLRPTPLAFSHTLCWAAESFLATILSIKRPIQNSWPHRFSACWNHPILTWSMLWRCFWHMAESHNLDMCWSLYMMGVNHHTTNWLKTCSFRVPCIFTLRLKTKVI